MEFIHVYGGKQLIKQFILMASEVNFRLQIVCQLVNCSNWRLLQTSSNRIGICKILVCRLLHEMVVFVCVFSPVCSTISP